MIRVEDGRAVVFFVANTIKVAVVTDRWIATTVADVDATLERIAGIVGASAAIVADRSLSGGTSSIFTASGYAVADIVVFAIGIDFAVLAAFDRDILASVDGIAGIGGAGIAVVAANCAEHATLLGIARITGAGVFIVADRYLAGCAGSVFAADFNAVAEITIAAVGIDFTVLATFDHGVMATVVGIARVRRARISVVAIERRAGLAAAFAAAVVDRTGIAVRTVGVVVGGHATAFSVTEIVGTDIPVVGTSHTLLNVAVVGVFVTAVVTFVSAFTRVSGVLALSFTTNIHAVAEEPIVARGLVVAVGAAVLFIASIVGTRITVIAVGVLGTFTGIGIVAA